MTKNVKRAIILFFVSVPVIISGAAFKVLSLPLSGILLVSGLVMQIIAAIYFCYIFIFKIPKKESSQR